MHRPNYIPFVADDFEKAVESAAKGRKKRPEVKEALKDVDGFCASIKQRLKDGSWRKDIEYRKLTKVNNNKKVRHIDAPTFRTLVYEHLLKNKLEPIYRRRDPLVSLNCKEGCGITPSAKHKELKSNYVLPRVKHLFYDLREMNWIVTADQRKCYMHVKPSVFRKELKHLIGDKWLIDFAVELCFVDGQLPVGTPTSPLAHHILMLRFHEWLCRNTEWQLCYADNCMVACRTREEAQRMKWRIEAEKEYGKKNLLPLEDVRIVDECGYIFEGSTNQMEYIEC